MINIIGKIGVVNGKKCFYLAECSKKLIVSLYYELEWYWNDLKNPLHFYNGHYIYIKNLENIENVYDGVDLDVIYTVNHYKGNFYMNFAIAPKSN